MANKRDLKAYIRYDGNGRVIPGALLLQRFKPSSGGKWHEIEAYECCNSVPVLSLRLLFSNITEVSAIIGDASNVGDWNTYFDLPTYGNPFTSVSVIGNQVELIGGSNIIVKEMLFDQPDELGTYLLEVDDQAGCVIELEYDAFGFDNNSGCQNLTSINLPNCLTVGNFAFQACNNLATISIPKLQSIGDSVFQDCISVTTLSFPLLSTRTGTASSFGFCSSLTNVNIPLLTNIVSGDFGNCPALTNINISSCTSLGFTVGDDGVFAATTGNTITLTVPSALMTVDAGDPDGDIQYLIANNTVTVVTV